MVMPNEPDFPPGHPARFDYDPESREAKEWARLNIHLKGERDFPVGHPKAEDTPGNTNARPVLAGIDPDRPEREAFTGRSPEQAAALRKLYQQQSAQAKETPALVPVIAANPAPAVGKVRAKEIADNSGYLLHCPGCNEPHKFDSRWQFNGNQELPSFTPSMLIDRGDPARRCHSFVTNGNWVYLEDCGHRLKGQTVQVPTWESTLETINA